MDTMRSLLELHMAELCKGIGARPTGSEANKAAVRYAARTFRDLGMDVALQDFPCMDWKNSGAHMTVDGVDVDVMACQYSLPCDVEGPLVCVGSIDELSDAELEGKICVMHGELCKEPLMPKAMVFWNPEEHQRIIRELEQKKPLAVIAASPLADIAMPIIQDGDFDVPCAVVKGELLDTLRSCKGSASLKLETERRPSTAANVIATHGSGERKVCFSAHIDTNPNTPGALDNTSGVAVLLALAASMREKAYPFQIEFVLFNGEDYYSMPGEMAFQQIHLQTPGQYLCAFNVDGIGLRDSKTSYSFYECPDELQVRIDRFAATSDDVERIDPWPMGDHMMFAMCGVPAIALTASDIFALVESVLHTSKDNLAMIDMDKLEAATSFLLGCI